MSLNHKYHYNGTVTKMEISLKREFHKKNHQNENGNKMEMSLKWK